MAGVPEAETTSHRGTRGLWKIRPMKNISANMFRSCISAGGINREIEQSARVIEFTVTKSIVATFSVYTMANITVGIQTLMGGDK